MRSKENNRYDYLPSKIKYILDWSSNLKAIYLSQFEFRTLDVTNDLDLSDKVAISIVTTPKDKFSIYGNWADKIQLSFEDSKKKETCIQPDQTKQLYDFIMKHKDKHFVIHCLAGISRSAAIAIFINELFVEHFINAYYDHNGIVYTQLKLQHENSNV